MTESSSTSFFTKLEKRVSQVDSLLCVGLDPHGAQILGDAYASSTQSQKCDAAFTFCKTIIDATLEHAACYKPNAAFFEALGAEDGTATLVRVLKEIPPEVPILLDVKRGDIGSTAAAYAEACYDHCGADAVTLSPLMGWDSVAPFVTGKVSPSGDPNRIASHQLLLTIHTLCGSNLPFFVHSFRASFRTSRRQIQ